MPTEEEILACIKRLKKRDDPKGYFLNPNIEDLKVVIDGYLTNEERFGYPACPCRLPAGERDKDRDIICPCDYRDDDIAEHGACYCSLYVSEDVARGRKKVGSIPERRPPGGPIRSVASWAAAAASPTAAGVASQAAAGARSPAGASGPALRVPVNVWRCTVCGYLAAKDQPPPKCPICGVGRDRFELFIKAG